jgi:hypothetical protein
MGLKQKRSFGLVEYHFESNLSPSLSLSVSLSLGNVGRAANLAYFCIFVCVCECVCVLCVCMCVCVCACVRLCVCVCVCMPASMYTEIDTHHPHSVFDCFTGLWRTNCRVQHVDTLVSAPVGDAVLKPVAQRHHSA